MAKLSEHPDQKRHLLKRRLEQLTKSEAEERERLKVRRQKLDELLVKIDQEYAEIAMQQMYCDDLATIVEMRNKELAKLDSDRLFNDIDQTKQPESSSLVLKPLAPKNGGKKAAEKTSNPV